MKPTNFPLRKLLRKARAEGWTPTEAEKKAARERRTKKVGGKAQRQWQWRG
jgi:hypothetical protein